MCEHNEFQFINAIRIQFKEPSSRISEFLEPLPLLARRRPLIHVRVGFSCHDLLLADHACPCACRCSDCRERERPREKAREKNPEILIMLHACFLGSPCYYIENLNAQCTAGPTAGARLLLCVCVCVYKLQRRERQEEHTRASSSAAFRRRRRSGWRRPTRASPTRRARHHVLVGGSAAASTTL